MTPLETPPKSRPRVLVIDGEPGGRRLLERLVDRLGCAAVVAASASEAHALCEHRPRFLLAIVDPELAGTDGLELCRALRAHLGERAAPFVLFTKAPPARLPDGVLAAARKPDELPRLVAVIKSALASRARRAGAPRAEQRLPDVTETYATRSRPTEAPPALAGKSGAHARPSQAPGGARASSRGRSRPSLGALESASARLRKSGG